MSGFIAQSVTAPGANTIFFLTLALIFVAAIITTIFTKWARDKCLKFFDDYHVTLERIRGQTTWGTLKVFSTGIEIVYDHPFTDVQGRQKSSSILYAADLEPQVLGLFRYHNEMDEAAKKRRIKQVKSAFNPGPIRRANRNVRNIVNTLRDAFNAAIGLAIGQAGRVHPAGAVLATQGQSVTAIGQTLIGRFAGNAFEPLLEQYIGQPVILEVVDPLNPNNATVQFAGFLADYTQSYIAVFNVSHETAETLQLSLPDAERGNPLPPLPAPPAVGSPPMTLPPAIATEHGLEVRLDGFRLKIHNTNHDPIIVRKLTRDGFADLAIGMVIPPRGTLDLPARDARGGKLHIEKVRCLDVVAPRKYAIIRHAGRLVDRRGFAEELGLSQLPLVPTLFGLEPSTNHDPDTEPVERTEAERSAGE